MYTLLTLMITSFSNTSLILRDLSCWLDPVLDWASLKLTCLSKSVLHIHYFFSTYVVKDIWQNLDVTDGLIVSIPCSLMCITPFLILGWYFFLDNYLTSFMSACEYFAIVISDHAPLMLTLSVPALLNLSEWSWHFNSTLLSDDTFLEFMNNQLTCSFFFFFLETNISPNVYSSLVWDFMKAYLWGQIISYTANMKREKLKEILADKIKDLDHQYAHIKDLEVYRKCTELETKFELLSTHIAERQLLKSRSTFFVHGEKSSKLLANQIRHLKPCQCITAINSDDGLVTDHKKN